MTNQDAPLVKEARAVYQIAGEQAFGRCERLAGFMGLKRRKNLSALALADLVADGLPVASADHLDRLLSFSGVLSHAGGRPIHAIVSEPTLRRSRKKKQALSCQASERIYNMARVLEALSHVFRDDQASSLAFLERPHMLLSGRRPFEVACSSTAGANAVIELLEQAEASFAI